MRAKAFIILYNAKQDLPKIIESNPRFMSRFFDLEDLHTLLRTDKSQDDRTESSWTRNLARRLAQKYQGDIYPRLPQ